MMESFDDFLENIKKVEIVDEEFKKELKNKLYILYEKRKSFKTKLIFIKSLSYAAIILLVLIPTFYILNNIFIKKTSLENSYLVRTYQGQYEDKISKIIEDDELLEEKLVEDRLVKIYNSGIKIYEKNGNFEKIKSGEENLIEYNINLENISEFLKKEDEKQILSNKVNINNILEIFKKDKRFDFINIDIIKEIININENLIVISFQGEKGDWVFLIDINLYKIIYFEYPF